MVCLLCVWLSEFFGGFICKGWDGVVVWWFGVGCVRYICFVFNCLVCFV